MTRSEKETPTISPVPTNEDVDNASKDKKSKQSVVNEAEKKKQAFITRTIWSIVMMAFFFVFIFSGHFPMMCMVFIFQTLTFREIISLTSEPARDKKIPYNKSLNWYFLFATTYYLDAEKFYMFISESVFANRFVAILAINHKLISYFFYIMGFIFFVWTLKKGYYKFQFAQLCITHMTLFIVVLQSHLIIDNIANGIIWLVLPASLVGVNDTFAYLCGITFGRTQLIEISPKKTVEGFVGAWICTSIAAIFLSFFMSQSDYMICPAESLTHNIFNYPHCEPNPVFVPQIYQVPSNIAEIIGIDLLTFSPIYFHATIIATFASLIAPFGGFFASGLKRAFGIKDFSDTIPGHGGVTDRFDCQFLMGSFSYLYYHTFISSNNVNVGTVLQMAIINLSAPQLLQLVKSLLKYLHATGHLESKKLAIITELLSDQ